MLSLSDVSLAYGSRMLFDQVTLHLAKGRRYGIVGANGTGKSSLLRLLAGEESPSLGSITRSKGMRLGYLRQDQYRFEHECIRDVVIQGRPELWKAFREKEQLLSKEGFEEADGYRILELEETIARLDGYVAEQLAEELLCGLGIGEPLHTQPLATLSGGYKLRVLLAQALFNEPDALLLDEPTNYLDVRSISWLVSFLQGRFRGILAFVSHDVWFLNSVATHILDIDYGEVRLYQGDYHRFVKEKEAISEQKQKEHQSIQRYVARQRVFIERFRGKPTRARQSLSREKQLERIEWPDIRQSSRVSPRFCFRSEQPTGRRVLRAIGLSKRYRGVAVVDAFALEVMRGEKLAIIGANGVGKSTVLKMLVDNCEPDDGTIEWGQRTRVAYFAQEAHETRDQTLVDWLAERHAFSAPGALHQALGQVLFSKEEAFKKVCQLSGGEFARLRLALVMLQKPNVLVLDEPTNHLDLEARQALAQALASYEGTVLVVSHDRGFLQTFASRIVLMEPGQVFDFSGENWPGSLNP